MVGAAIQAEPSLRVMTSISDETQRHVAYSEQPPGSDVAYADAEGVEIITQRTRSQVRTGSLPSRVGSLYACR